MIKVTSLFRLHKRNVLTLLIVVFFLWSLSSVQWSSELFHPGGRAIILQILKALIKPDLSIDILNAALIASLRTLAYAVAGMSAAVIIAFFLGILASGVLSDSKLTKWLSRLVFRGILGFSRAIHELIWAWFFVTAIGLSPLAAVFALAIPYGGILGRIYADILNDVPSEPIKALKAAGASRLQILLYGYLPISKADMISYTMYRLECAVRSSTIMSFIGLGGLGYQIQMALQDLNFNQVWTYLFFLIALVAIIDLWSNQFRKRLIA